MAEREATMTANFKRGLFRVWIVLEFAVAHWAELRAKIVWDNNPSRSKLHAVPNISEVFYNREDILHYMQNPKGVIKKEVQKSILILLKFLRTTPSSRHCLGN